jgi:hypothetical protein
MSSGYSVRIAFTFVLFCTAAVQVLRAYSPEMTPIYDANETKNHIGEYATVRGTVAEVTISSRGNSFLQFCGRWPKQCFSVKIPKEQSARFGMLVSYEGATVEVTGKIGSYRDRGAEPEMVIESPGQIKVVDK